MMAKSKIIGLTLALGFVFLFCACEDGSTVQTESKPNIVSKKISQPVVPVKPPEKKGLQTNGTDKSTAPEVSIAASVPLPGKLPRVSDEMVPPKEVHYDSQGKIDPFVSLIQEKSEETTSIVDDRPKRILTPLEKIELSQIRLVAVILMKNKQIAMVEDASGKGYEIGVGTYIGKSQGRVSEIKNSSIVIKELVQDYKGRRKEHVQEIKLYKNDNEE